MDSYYGIVCYTRYKYTNSHFVLATCNRIELKANLDMYTINIGLEKRNVNKVISIERFGNYCLGFPLICSVKNKQEVKTETKDAASQSNFTLYVKYNIAYWLY